MKKYSLTLALLLVTSAVFSQVQEQWVARYNSPDNGQDYANALALDRTGNVYVTGWSYANTSDYDYGTVKYNSSGVQQWAARYTGPGNNVDKATSVAVDALGNVYVTGWSFLNAANCDYVTVKYNSSGVQQWAASYAGPGAGLDFAIGLGLDNAGNVYVTGTSTGSGTGFDIATVKYNSSGVQQWAQRFHQSYSKDTAYAIVVDGAGNACVAGWVYLSGSNYDYVTIKYNTSGVQQWAATYDGPASSYDLAYNITCDGAGNVYTTGWSSGISTGADYGTVKYNSSGVQQWVGRYAGPYTNGTDLGYSVKVDGAGNVYVTGLSWGSGSWQDYATVKYNPSGVQQWVARYNGPANNWEWAYQLALDSAANVYVTGFSVGNNTDRDYATVKYNSLGVQQWVIRYDGPVNFIDEAKAIETDTAGNVYVTGFSYGLGVNYDYVTIKYSQMVGIQPISNRVPNSYKLFQNYPNPFNPVTKINFEIPSTPLSSIGEGTGVRLEIYDILGREVATLVNQQLRPGTYEVEWDATNNKSGVYFSRLESGMFNETKKLILIK